MTFIVSCPVAAWVTLPVTVSVTVVFGDVAKISRSAFMRYGYGFDGAAVVGMHLEVEVRVGAVGVARVADVADRLPGLDRRAVLRPFA